MTTDSGIEIVQKQEKEEIPGVKIQLGLTRDGRPEYLVLPYEQVIKGDLSKFEAIKLLTSAEYGIRDLRMDLGAQGASSPEHPLFPDYVAMGVTSYVFEAVSKQILNVTVTSQNERAIIQSIIGACSQQGLLNMHALVKSAEAQFIFSQLDEKDRQSAIAKNHRLFSLGFMAGYNGTIVSFKSANGEEVDFPHTNFSLPEAERWSDVEKKAIEAGFIFDQQGRVAGFKTKDGNSIEIPEKDRGKQIKMR